MQFLLPCQDLFEHLSSHLIIHFLHPLMKIPQRRNLPRFAHMVDVHSLKVSKLFKFDFHFNESSQFCPEMKARCKKSPHFQVVRSLKHQFNRGCSILGREIDIKSTIQKYPHDNFRGSKTHFQLSGFKSPFELLKFHYSGWYGYQKQPEKEFMKTSNQEKKKKKDF